MIPSASRRIAIVLGIGTPVWLLAGGSLAWVFLGWGLFLLDRAVRGRRRGTRLVALNLAALFLVFAAAEAYAALRVRRNAERRSAQAVEFAAMQRRLRAAEDDASWVRWDPGLGWTGRPNGHTRSRREREGRTIYDVEYHVDEHGLRVPPPHDPTASECLLFFGCSYTFGEGVEDHETYPWRVGVDTGGRYRVYNFALPGYGPQHMLTWLEDGRAEAVLDCTPRHAFYLWIGNHLSRVSGVEPWMLGSARYRLDPSGKLVHDGQFGDGSGAETASAASWPKRWLSRSALLSETYRATVTYREHARLQAAVVAAARDIVASRWPRAEFHVLFWDDPFSLKHAIVRAAFERERLELTDVTPMLPGFLEDEDRFWLDPSDHHPNAATQARIADWLARHVVGAGDRTVNGGSGR